MVRQHRTTSFNPQAVTLSAYLHAHEVVAGGPLEHRRLDSTL